MLLVDRERALPSHVERHAFEIGVAEGSGMSEEGHHLEWE